RAHRDHDAISSRLRERRDVVNIEHAFIADAPAADLFAVEIERVLRIADDLDLRVVAVRRQIEVARREEGDRQLPADVDPRPDPARRTADVEKFTTVNEVEPHERG